MMSDNSRETIGIVGYIKGYVRAALYILQSLSNTKSSYDGISRNLCNVFVNLV